MHKQQRNQSSSRLKVPYLTSPFALEKLTWGFHFIQGQ